MVSKLLRSSWLLLICAPLVAGTAFADEGGKKKKKDKGGEAKTDDAKEGKGKKGKKGDDGGGGGYSAPYGMAGCGLGSTILKDDTKLMQIFAGTLNSVSGNQTFAISSTHSSNCKAGKEEANLIEQEVFVASNLRSLEVDVTRGGGNFSYAFAQVLGCDDDNNYSEFMEVSRLNYNDIFASSDPETVYQHYMNALRTSNKLISGCARIITKT